MPEKNAVWWWFKTASAPEPLGIIDNGNYKNLTPDPDWNGPATIENVDFCSVVLKWCSAKVDPSSKESVYQQNIGHNQALSYQMMIGYNEKSQVTAYNNMISSLWKLDIWGTIQGLVEIAAPYLGLNYTSSKANQCHYLLVDKTNPNQPVCRAEIITPHTALKKPRQRSFPMQKRKILIVEFLLKTCNMTGHCAVVLIILMPATNPARKISLILPNP